MLHTLDNLIFLSNKSGYKKLANILSEAKPCLSIKNVQSIGFIEDTLESEKTLCFLFSETNKPPQNNCIYFTDLQELYKTAYQLSDVIRKSECEWYNMVIEANLKFNDITLKQPDLVTMIKYFNQLMKNPVIIYDEFYNIIAITDPSISEYDEEPEEPQRFEMRNLFYFKQRVNFKNPNLKKQSCNRLLYPVLPAGGGMWKGYLAIFDLETPYEEMDMMILEIFANSALTEMRRRLEIREIERKFISDFIYDLIYRKEAKEKEITRRAKELNLSIDADYCIIAINPLTSNESNNQNIRFGSLSQYEFTNDLIMNRINNFNSKVYEQDIITKFDSTVYILHKLGQISDIESQEDLKVHCNKMLKMLQENFDKMAFEIGIGETVKGITSMSSSFHQANATLSYGEILNGPKQSFVISYADNSLLKLFGRLKEIDCLDEMIPENLQKICEYDTKYNSQFYITLKMYLDCNCNAKKAADKLFIHYKTMLYRIEKLKNTFSIDLEDANTRLFLELGIHLLDMQRKQ